MNSEHIAYLRRVAEGLLNNPSLVGTRAYWWAHGVLDSLNGQDKSKELVGEMERDAYEDGWLHAIPR